MDIKLLPRTNISYDQLWTYYKGDTGIGDFAQPFQVNPTQNVDLGVSLNAGASQPCAGTFLASGFVNPTCSAYFNGYLNHGRTRTNTPTEQLTVQSITGRIGTSRRGSVTRAGTPTYSTTTRHSSAASRGAIFAAKSTQGLYLDAA